MKTAPQRAPCLDLHKERALSPSRHHFYFWKEASLLPASWLRLISDLWLKPAAGCGCGKAQSICTTPSTLMASLPFGHRHRCFSHQGMMSSQCGGGNTPVKSKLQSFLCRAGPCTSHCGATAHSKLNLNVHWCSWKIRGFEPPPLLVNHQNGLWGNVKSM